MQAHHPSLSSGAVLLLLPGGGIGHRSSLHPASIKVLAEPLDVFPLKVASV